MADRTGRPDPRLTGQRLELDSSELDDMIREQMRDGGSDAQNKEKEKERDTKVTDREEPDVKVEDHRTVTDDKSRTVEDDPLQKALATISSLQTDIETLKRERVPSDTRTRIASDREPSVDFEEVLPNVRLPKDTSKWPIVLTEKDLEKLGLEPSAAKGLNILANAMYAFILDTVPTIANERFSSSLNQREQRQKDEKDFFDAYPDLAGNQDLLSMVETPEFFNENKSFGRKKYMENLADAVTDRIAKIRGMTRDEYLTNVRSKTTRSTGTSRAVVSSGSGGRGSGRSKPNDNQREMDDMWNG